MASSKGVDAGPVELRQCVADREPRCLGLDQDVSLGSKAGIVIEDSGLHLQQWALRGGIRYRRSASGAKRGAIWRRLGAEGRFVPLNQLFALEKVQVLAQYTQPGHEG